MTKDQFSDQLPRPEPPAVHLPMEYPRDIPIVTLELPEPEDSLAVDHPLVGTRVTVELQSAPHPVVIVTGVLLKSDEYGQIEIRDDNGDIRYCWPALRIVAGGPPERNSPKKGRATVTYCTCDHSRTEHPRGAHCLFCRCASFIKAPSDRR